MMGCPVYRVPASSPVVFLFLAGAEVSRENSRSECRAAKKQKRNEICSGLIGLRLDRPSPPSSQQPKAQATCQKQDR